LTLSFKISPIIIKQVNRKEPPAEINGNGNPLTGIKPTVMAVFTKTCAINTEAKPIRAILEKRSLDKKDRFNICMINNPNTRRTIKIEINPNSSPITDNIKSDS
jgi:hypothetical protein